MISDEEEKYGEMMVLVHGHHDFPFSFIKDRISVVNNIHARASITNRDTFDNNRLVIFIMEYDLGQCIHSFANVFVIYA